MVLEVETNNSMEYTVLKNKKDASLLNSEHRNTVIKLDSNEIK